MDPISVIDLANPILPETKKYSAAFPKFRVSPYFQSWHVSSLKLMALKSWLPVCPIYTPSQEDTPILRRPRRTFLSMIVQLVAGFQS